MKRWWICFLLVLSAFSASNALAEALPPIALGFYNRVILDVPRKDVEVSLKFWIDEMAESIKLPFKPIRFYDSMADMRRALNAGEINFMIASSMGVAQNFSNEELRGGFSAQRSQADHLFLVVRKGSNIQRFTDLAGKRISLLSEDELSDVYLETLVMKSWGKPDNTRFSAVARQKRSIALVHDLFFGRTDAVLVRRNSIEAASILNPQIAQQLVVLEDYTFKGKAPNIGFFSAKVTPEQAEAITNAVLTLGDTARGRQVLEIYHAESMVRTKVQDLDPFRELLSQHRTLLAAAGAASKKGGGR